MAQFNFGSNAGNTAATPNFGFGAKPAAPAFGASQPSGSITFGTPIASVAPTQSTGFGTPQGLNFGATTTSTPATGFGAQTQKLSFGALATPAQQTPGLNFGAASTPSTGLGFGSTATPSTGLSFGATPAPTTGLSFGAAPPASTGLSFGAPASGGLTLGTSTAQTTAPTGLFGAQTPASSTAQPALGGLSFGAPAASAASVGFSLGGTSTAGFSLGGTPASTASTGLSFGAPASSAPATGLSFGGLTGASTTPASTGLNFKGTSFAPASTAAAPTTGLNFNFGGVSKPAATNTLTLGATTTQTPSVGLGGVDTAQNKSGAVTTGRADTIAAKENAVPNEILQTIENFKTFVKEQKVHSSDVSRGSARPFLKVGEDIDLLNSILSEVGNELQRNQQVANKLKNDSARCLHDAEMAQRTYDTPPGLQFENTAPMQYFIDLVNQFEQELQAIRMQIDVTDKHVQSLQEPKFLTSQDLSLGMRRLHDTFVALAGRLQSVHTQVESQKEQYLNLRKYILKDPTNIFLTPVKQPQAVDVSLQNYTRNISVPGPTPFTPMGTSSMGMMMMAPQQEPNKPPPAYPTGNTSLNFGAPTTQMPSNTLLGSTPTLGANTSLFGNTTAQLGQSPAPDSSGFQLQNPPLGNKRGKR